jgi:hypothetical protein
MNSRIVEIVGLWDHWFARGIVGSWAFCICNIFMKASYAWQCSYTTISELFCEICICDHPSTQFVIWHQSSPLSGLGPWIATFHCHQKPWSCIRSFHWKCQFFTHIYLWRKCEYEIPICFHSWDNWVRRSPRFHESTNPWFHDLPVNASGLMPYQILWACLARNESTWFSGATLSLIVISLL